MSGSPYDVFDDPYCYKGTTVLKNKLGLRDQAQLTDYELEMTALRAREPFPDGGFDPSHYCAVHHHLFQDVYVWAGRYRTVRTAKGGNVFCYPEHIDRQMTLLFARLRADPFLGGATRAAFVAAASGFLSELNVIHCFREGNGRAQLSFMHLLAERAGHPVRLDRVRPTEFLNAMIASFAGDLTLLQKEIARLCRKPRGR